MISHPPPPLTLLPLASPFDLHWLGTPPAFILSQDQTLRSYLTDPVACFVLNGWFSSRYTRYLAFLSLFSC